MLKTSVQKKRKEKKTVKVRVGENDQNKNQKNMKNVSLHKCSLILSEFKYTET